MVAGPIAEDAPLPASLRGDSVAASVIILVVMTLVQRGVGLLRSLLFCHWLSPAELGQWDLAFGFLLLAAPVAVLGLPGSFGRYVEYYRSRGQLRRFLARTSLVSVALATTAVGGLWLLAHACAEPLFGRGEKTGLVRILALVLGTVILQNFLVSLLTAMRQVRVVSTLQFASGLLFAFLGCGLMLLGVRTTEGVLLAFGVATLVSSLGALWVVRTAVHELPAEQTPLPHADLWRQLMPFAFWVWISNWLANLFHMADRYLLLHHSSLSDVAALDLVGQYHSARLIPLIFLGLSELIAAMMLPHLSRDWEAGRRETVIQRLNLYVKLSAVVTTTAGCGVLLGAPLLFGLALGGKYHAGWSVLPWTMVACALGGLVITAQNYLWCAERARSASLALAAALIVSLGLNSLLIPAFGLSGAVAGTALAQAVSLAGVFLVARSAGMRYAPSTLGLTLAPWLLVLGPVVAAVGLGALAVLICTTTWILSPWEREQLGSLWEQARARLARLRGSRPAAPSDLRQDPLDPFLNPFPDGDDSLPIAPPELTCTSP